MTEAEIHRLIAAEAALLDRHRQGDRGAFEELVLTYKDAVYGYLCRCRIPAATRDDLAQEVFMRVHKALSRFTPEEGRASLKAWIFTIVANAARSHFRHLGVEQRALETAGAEDSDFVPEHDASSEDALAGKEMAVWLDVAVQRLPIAEREAVILVCIEGIDQEEAARALEIPINTLKTHLRRGRLRLAEALARRGAILQREQRR
ncbi:MAG: sigma-70 family RNA polymerase sigma factor [Deltaproteobacteria bacterium]|nr:sigma-70 family RNA polymerase sigma factor [Deltaproteobacteria bacterium]